MKTSKVFYLVLFITLFSSFTSSAQKNLVDDLISKYGGKWPKTISFTQDTYIYTDSTKIYQEWFEIGVFPHLFRIDFDMNMGNSAIFNGEKQYRFTNNQLTRTLANNNPLIFLVGGMYFYSATEVKEKLLAIGVNINLEREGTWKGKKVRIVGEENNSQLWYDADQLYLVKFVQKVNDKITMEFDFYGHQNINGNWHETHIDFYQNGKLTQEEIYRDYKTNIKVDEEIFNPEKFGKIHWIESRTQ